jgi:hypothetical protein
MQIALTHLYPGFRIPRHSSSMPVARCSKSPDFFVKYGVFPSYHTPAIHTYPRCDYEYYG